MRTLEQVLVAHPLPLKNPDGTPAYLKPLQIEDINKLAAFGRALGDLPVGYGKTAIATCVALMLEPPVTLILVPPILVDQWVKWLGAIPGAGRAVSYAGTPRERRALALRGARWVVTSYGLFRNDIERLTRELPGAMTIMDEAQNAKSYKSILFQNLRDFSEGLPLLLMSGTIMSKPSDGYSYVKLNSPEVYQRYVQFTNIHVAKWDFFDQPEEWKNLDLLQANLDLARVKRTKEEVHAHLPKVNFIPLEYKLDPEHMALYHKLMDEQLLEVGDGKIDATTAGKLYSASQQIIANWGYFADDETKISKLYELIDVILDEIGIGQPLYPGERRSKLIIWSIFKRTSRGLLAYLNAKGLVKGKNGKPDRQVWRAVGAYGEVDSKEGVRAFMEDDDALVGVFQPGSAGAGLNPQYVCNEMFFAEFPTTTIPFWQCCGRIDREGQIYNPNIRLAIALGTVQFSLQRNLFDNDKLVQQASGTKQSIKDLIYPK